MTQEKLAGLSNITRVNLSLIETGKAEPGLRTVALIARALNMKPSELLEGIE